MTASEIENLATDYLTGNLSEEEKVTFEQLLEQDERIRQKVNDLRLVWNALDMTPKKQIIEVMDDNFYAMLNKQTHTLQPDNIIYRIQPVLYWWASVAAVIVFVIAFCLGKYNSDYQQIVKYKILQVVKQGPVQTRYVKVYVAQNAEKKKAGLGSYQSPVVTQNQSPLMAQLQSPYSSTRISAVLAVKEGKLSEADLKALGSALKNDPDPNVQLAIVQTLQPKASSTGVQRLLINALPFVQGTVQSSMIDILFANKSKEAIPQMLALLHNDSTAYHTQGQIKQGIEEFLN